MPGQGLLLVMADVDQEWEDEFNAWSNEEFIPSMLGVPGVLSARRYRVVEGTPKYLALYDLAELNVLERPEYLRLRPWDPEATSRARRIFSACRLTQGVYRRAITLPEPEPGPDDLSRAPALMFRAFDVRPEHDEEFHDWYFTEHVPIISGVTGVVRSRGFRLEGASSELVGNPPTYVGLYDLERPEVQRSQEWWGRISTPWAIRIRRLYISRARNVCERVFPA